MKQSITFADFSDANERRCIQAFHPIDEWSPTDWMCCVAGEVGEAANLIKKLKRGERIDTHVIGLELADAVTYIDLLMTRLGLDLGVYVRSKFNRVSDRVGSSVKL